MSKWCNIGWVEVVKRLNSDSVMGLSLKQVEEYTSKREHNNELFTNNMGILKLGLKALKSLWIIYTLIFTIFNILTRNYGSALVFFTLTLINLLILTFNQYIEEKRLDKLEKLNPTFCRVIRNGKIARLNPNELLVGDIVLVDKGETIPADLRIIDSENLKVKETAVTGDEFIVEKYSAKIEERELALSEMKNILFKSTSVVEGSATGIVIAVGFDTEIGKIIELLYKNRNKENVFNSTITIILNKVTIISFILLAIVILVNILLGKSFDYIIDQVNLTAICSGIYIIFPSIYIFNKVLNKNLRKTRIEINNLNSIEKLSNINTLVVDKIGFLSENKMTAVMLSTDGEKMDLVEGKKLDRVDENIDRLFQIALLTCDSKYILSSDIYNQIQLMEQALIKVSEDNGYDKNILDRSFRRTIYIPYDSERRINTAINKESGTYRAHVKGALDSILARCTHIMINGVEQAITDGEIKNIKNQHMKLLEQGLEVFGFAYRNFNYEPSTDENIESNLVYVGMIAFANPINLNTISCVEYLQNNNVNLVVTTEENKISAAASSENMGVHLDEENLMSGVEMENIDEAEMEELIQNIKIFSRVNTEHKKKTIQMLKKLNNFVAAAGYKFTDLAYLDICDLSIAISKKCSPLVKEMSDMWMEDSSFEELVELRKDSIKILSSIEKIFMFIIGSSFLQYLVQFINLLIFGQYNLYVFNGLTINIIIIPLIITAFSMLYKKINIGEDIIYKYSMFASKKINKLTIIKIICLSITVLSLITIGHLFFYKWIYEVTFLSIGAAILFFSYITSPKSMFKNRIFTIIVVIALLLLSIAIKIH